MTPRSPIIVPEGSAVLVVEDSPQELDAVLEVFEIIQVQGAVVTATSVEEAEEILGEVMRGTREQIHAALLDFHLHHKTSLPLFRHFHEHNPQLLAEKRVSLRSNQTSDYLQKVFEEACLPFPTLTPKGSFRAIADWLSSLA